MVRMAAEGNLQRDNSSVNLEVASLNPPAWILRPIDDDTVSELARSIENLGLLQPIMVRRVEKGYEVVFGNHRLEACRRLGLTYIPAIISNLSNDEAFLARVSENLVRNVRVNPVEEAEGYKMLLGKGWTINAIARKVGKSDSYICERLAMLERLDDSLRRKIGMGGHLCPSHAELLARIPDFARQRDVAGLIERKRLSVRSLESLLNAVPPPAKVQVEKTSGNCYLCVPREFADFMGLGAYVYMYMRGNKLILENFDRTTRRRGTRKRGLLLPVPSQVSHVRTPTREKLFH